MAEEQNNLSESQMDDFQREEKKELCQQLQTIVQKQSQHIQQLQSNAFQLANYLFLFQGIIVAVASNSSTSFQCRDGWIFVSLSLFASLFNLSVLIMMSHNYLRTSSEHDRSWRYYNELYRQLNETAETSWISETELSRKDYFREVKHKLVIAFGMLLIVGFTIITEYACLYALCRKDY